MCLGSLTLAILAPVVSGAQGVYVSIPPQAFVVEWLVGDLVEIEILLPPGASPATYEPTPKQMAALDRSQLYLQIGAPFEGPVLAKVSNLMPELRVVDCRTGIELEPIGGDGHDHGAGLLDPHIWLDPQRMKIIASPHFGRPLTTPMYESVRPSHRSPDTPCSSSTPPTAISLVATV
jgi:ABC-type Zn uptake system ZnuABC Zn-binding protein ZnuA